MDVNRDFLGVGAGNVVAGLVGAFPVNASPPRTAAVVSASGRTQVAGLAAAGALVLLIPAVALLEDLPLATLAAILIFIATRILHIHDLVDIARYDRFEFGLALITLFTVALVGVEQGIAVAVALAILDRTRLSARPHVHVLGRIPSTTSWGSARRHRTRHRGSRGTRGAVRDTPLVRQRRSFQDRDDCRDRPLRVTRSGSSCSTRSE